MYVISLCLHKVQLLKRFSRADPSRDAKMLLTCKIFFDIIIIFLAIFMKFYFKCGKMRGAKKITQAKGRKEIHTAKKPPSRLSVINFPFKISVKS